MKPSEQIHPRSRRKEVCIDQRDAVDLMLGKAKMHVDGLPDDATVDGVYYDPACLCFVLAFTHESFAPLAPAVRADRARATITLIPMP